MTSIGPRAVAAVALTAAFALLAPGEGSLDTDHSQPEVREPGSMEDPLGISGAMGGVKDLSTTDAVKLAADAEELSIPPVALAAYQRSATVLADADASCRLDWPLVAAIGMVESNHGRYGGSALGSTGVASPAIIGLRLDGQGSVAEIRDTDDGLYDHDTSFDRAVGPMQFIPSTWTYAGADGDGDHRRDPQDIDDAAVSAAAFLCAGTEDVSTDTGARSAVFRYNQSETYVSTVLQIADKYRNGEFPGAPTVNAGAPSAMRPTASALPGLPRTGQSAGQSTGPKAEQAPVAPAPTKTASDPVPAPQKPTPGTGGNDGSGSDGGDGGKDETGGDGSTTPTPTPTPTPTDPPVVEEPPIDVAETCATAVSTIYPDLVPDAAEEDGEASAPASAAAETGTETDSPEAPEAPQAPEAPEETETPQALFNRVVEACVTNFQEATEGLTAQKIGDFVVALKQDPKFADLLQEPDIAQ